MRTTAYAFAALALALSCAATGGERTVSAQVEGGAGKMLYLDRFQGNKPVHVDSVKLDAKGRGELKMPDLPLDFYALTMAPEQMLVVVLDTMDRLKVTTKADHFQDPPVVEGSPETALLYAFFAESNAFEAKRKALIDHLNADRNDTAAYRDLTSSNMAFYERCRTFVQEHKSSPAALSALRNMNMQQDMPLFLEVRDALRRTMPKSEYFNSFSMQVDRTQQQLAAQKAQQEQQAQLDNLIPVGSAAPDFKQNTPEGTPFGLSDLKGKVVLIDFWASWCRPCRMEMPNVKNVYDHYHAKGFEVLGVSLDKDKEAWTGAIRQDGLQWHHVSDLGFWNNAVAQQYGIGSIPSTVLVGRDGKVIAKNLRGPELEQKLAEVFK